MQPDRKPLERPYEHALPMRKVAVGKLHPTRAFEQLLHGDSTFHAADGCPETKVNPVTEAEVLPRALALKIDLVGIRPLSRVAIARRPKQHDSRVLG